MNAANNSSTPLGRVVPVLLVFAALIGLYYLYQYLFGSTTGNKYDLVTTGMAANIDPAKPIIITSDKLPTIFEGGEFTISAWIYVNNWSYRSGLNKSIIRIGGPNFDTVRVYLGGYQPSLNVRFQTSNPSAVLSVSDKKSPSLEKATLNSTFNILQTNAPLTDSSQGCDLSEIGLQRWVNITIAVNGRTVDVYYDGKLSRSCVLPDMFKVDAGGYSAYLLDYGGFGGQISTVSMYDAALNPEQVYKNYMAGPEPITNIGQWFASFFEPSISGTVTPTN